MAQKPGPARIPICAAASLLVKRSPRRDDSLFTPGRPIWCLPNLEVFRARFIEQPDVSKDSFDEKLQRQLEGAPGDVVQSGIVPEEPGPGASFLCPLRFVPNAGTRQADSPRYGRISMLRISALVALTLTLLIGSVGCSEIKTFTVVFANRLSAGHDIDCYVNGNLLGTVLSGATGEFSVETRRLQPPTGPDLAHASVVFAARDRTTGILSHEFPRTLSTDRTEYVEINEWDF